MEKLGNIPEGKKVTYFNYLYEMLKYYSKEIEVLVDHEQVKKRNHHFQVNVKAAIFAFFFLPSSSLCPLTLLRINKILIRVSSNVSGFVMSPGMNRLWTETDVLTKVVIKLCV